MSLAELSPHRFTVDDMWAMVRAGVLDEDAPVELIEGELIDMPPDGPAHISWSSALGFWLFPALDRKLYAVVPGSTLVLSETNAPKPDYYVVPADFDFRGGGGGKVLLAVEQADSSLRRDLGCKADLYARHGVRDYWVIELEAKRVHVHRAPRAGRYTDVRIYGPEDRLDVLLIPGLTLRLADLSQVD